MAKKLSFPKKFINYKLPRSFWVPQRFDTLSAFLSGKGVTSKGNTKTVSKTIPNIYNQKLNQGIESGSVIHGIVDRADSVAIDSPYWAKAKSFYTFWPLYDEYDTNEVVPRVLKWRCWMDLFAQTKFAGIFFLALLENGEVITSTQDQTRNLEQLARTACGSGDKAITIVCEFSSRMADSPYIVGENSYYWKAHVDFTIDKVLDEYFQHCAQKELEEQNPLSLVMGIASTHADGYSVSFTGFDEYLLTLEERSVGQSILATL